MLQAYIWNFYAASQIVLRESLIDVLEYIVLLQDRDEADEGTQGIIQKQREWIDVLSAVVLESFPQLLGFVRTQKQLGRGARQGKMAGRLFALFSMWVIQQARFTSVQHKQTAAEVVTWINSRHGLG